MDKGHANEGILIRWMPSCMVVFKGKAQSVCVADLLSADLVYMCVFPR